MNLLYGEVVNVYSEEGMAMAKLRVGGAVLRVSCDLVPDAGEGDTLLVCDGVAIGKAECRLTKEAAYVSGDSR